MQLHSIGAHQRPEYAGRPAAASKLQPAAPTRSVDLAVPTADDTAAAEQRHVEKVAERTEKYATRIDRMLEQGILGKLEERLDSFVTNHDLGDAAADAVADLKSVFDSTLEELRAQLADNGYDRESIRAFKTAVKDALAALREGVRDIAANPPADDVAPVEGPVDEVAPVEEADAVDEVDDVGEVDDVDDVVDVDDVDGFESVGAPLNDPVDAAAEEVAASFLTVELLEAYEDTVGDQMEYVLDANI